LLLPLVRAGMAGWRTFLVRTFHFPIREVGLPFMQTSLMSILTPALAGAPATRIGTAMGLQLMLMQWDYGSLFWLGLFTLFAIICLLPMVCEERERRSTRHRTARYPPPYWERRSRYQAPRILEDADRPSSPVGGTCLACGAIIREELSSRCPVCGAERQRCPICQRFVAGGQELLACPYCARACQRDPTMGC